MPVGNSKTDWNRLEASFSEGFRWVALDVTIQEISDENKALVQDLSNYDLALTVPLLASLLTLPEYQSNCIRLEILVALALVHCRGRKKANIGQAARWFSQIGKSKCVAGEDPAEDVFVSLVQDRRGDYRILEGVWEAAGFYTQRVLDVIATTPDSAQFRQIKKSVRSLLIISDMVCEKAGLHRYQLGSDERHSALFPRKLPGRNILISHVTITFAELDKHGISHADIEPFLFHPEMREDLSAQHIGLSSLDRFPLIVHAGEHLTVALPSALSVAIRDYVIANVMKGGLVKTFDGLLAKNYAQLLHDTPLLGGPMHAPVHWRKLGKDRWSNFYSKIDEGYFISCHLFLPSVETHLEGGFKSTYQEKGALTEALQKSIDDVLKHFEKEAEFKEGLVILVGCGWGKSYATQVIELDHPKWRCQCMSVADLVRLSCLSDMNPAYFWRIQDGLEAVSKAGVQIVNPNGILNLIGWVRKNDGHFVPHALLPEDEISLDQPLLLNLPLNLLREVRADVDLGYDRHRAVDNTGTGHDVQHVSPDPFFSRESSRRIYASIDDLRNGTLTSVYEGTLQLWMSVAMPNIAEKEIEFQFWEMACEWLHRIGNALDARAPVAKEPHCLRVYVEFRDGKPPKIMGEKPAPRDLISKCVIETHNESNACRVVFEAGFLSGFSIAENIAERLFVRTLTRAFLNLLGVENCDGETEAIEALTVQNDEARSSHIFYSQYFMDYVRDSLPKEIVAIDPIDDAAAKIGLGWRVINKEQGNKIEGREDCTIFLEKIVDVLLAEISDALKTFDRLSALTRFVANSEKARDGKDHWKRTSAAILGLHGDQPSTVDLYIEQMSKFSGAGIASRILCEIALCVCPSKGGGQLSDIEFSKLIARAALVSRIGGLSDAIHYNALAPELTISPLGDILFRDEFGSLVVNPMLSKMIGSKFIADSPLQKKNYEDPRVVAEAKKKIPGEFREIWKSEMGFTIDEGRNIIDALVDKGVEDHTAIFTIKQSGYISLVRSDKVSENAATRFLEQFSLVTRQNWDKPPKGFQRKDVYPWRLDRRLSFVTRPILKVDDSDDPLLIIAPGGLQTGFFYVFDGAYTGRLDQSFFHSHAMRDNWWGKAREGHTFNADVARALSEANWQVLENVGIPELLNRKMVRDFGDVDVLAWRPNTREVLVIECKDLSDARNYSEIAALLSDYQGVETNGKADKLRRHLNRVFLLQKNRDQLQKFTEIEKPQIVSCLVCSGVVPMQYAKIDALANTHVGGIEDLLER